MLCRCASGCSKRRSSGRASAFQAVDALLVDLEDTAHAIERVHHLGGALFVLLGNDSKVANSLAGVSEVLLDACEAFFGGHFGSALFQCS
jgi:hypothetical protein